MPNDLKKKVEILDVNLNDSSEIDCISISDNEMEFKDETVEIVRINDELIEENISDTMVASPNANMADLSTQTLDVQWCNMAAHCGEHSHVQLRDKETQTTTFKSQNMATQTIQSEMATSSLLNAENELRVKTTGEIAVHNGNSSIELIDADTQTIAVECNMVAHKSFLSSKAKRRDNYTQTETISSSEAATQVDFETIKLECELINAKESIKQLNKRLGDEIIGSDSSESIDCAGASDREEENFSDSSESEKQFDNRFSLKYGFITNVCVNTYHKYNLFVFMRIYFP